MKTRLLFLAVSVVMALTSCSAELIDPADGQVTKSVLETEYNALKVDSVLPDISSLPAPFIDYNRKFPRKKSNLD